MHLTSFDMVDIRGNHIKAMKGMNIKIKIAHADIVLYNKNKIFCCRLIGFVRYHSKAMSIQ